MSKPIPLFKNRDRSPRVIDRASQYCIRSIFSHTPSSFATRPAARSSDDHAMIDVRKIYAFALEAAETELRGDELAGATFAPAAGDAALQVVD